MKAQKKVKPQGVEVLDDVGLNVRADPDKLFFIENLIKDIELIPAILDLADNSIDSARMIALRSLAFLANDEFIEEEPAQSAEGAENEDEDESGIELPDGTFMGLRVELTVTADQFEIVDNCGGMSLDIARNYAFRFGRPKGFDGVPGSVGEFGVGMKRALFKLGRRFAVTSRSETEWFELKVDVDEWVDDQDEGDWSFRFDAAMTGMARASDDERGTRITVERLHNSVRQDFADELVISLLREQLRLRHQVALDLGLEIVLNGERLTGLRPALLSGPGFHPVRRIYVVDDAEGSVTVEVIAGIVRTDRREQDQNDGAAENFKTTSEAGWWVFCNNRLLLVADKSAETGWGNGAAAYHPQYRLFRGYVYMSSLETSLLPWNTTKTGVDADSRVWRRVQATLVTALVEVQAVLNRLKKEREELVDDEDGESGDSDGAIYTKALASAVPVPLRKLPRSASVTVPPVPKRTKATPRRQIHKIQYNVARDRYDKAMGLGFETQADLGRRSFDYFYKREVDDE